MSTKSISRPLLIAAGTVLALSGIGGYAWHETHRPKILELYVFDLPGTPGIFIRTPNDRRILVDGGANAEIVGRLTDILPFYSRRIDYVIVTDPVGKNVTGLIDILNRYRVGEVVLPGITLETLGLSSTTDQTFAVFSDTINSHSLPTKRVMAGNRLIFDTEGANSVSADVLFPVSADGFKYSKASGPELLMRINYGTTAIVIMGNASLKIQKFAATNDPMPADALIYSHSAIPSNVSRELVNSLAPEYLIFSQTITKTAGKKVAVDPLAGILNDHRFNVKRTGKVKITSDGVQIKIN